MQKLLSGFGVPLLLVVLSANADASIVVSGSNILGETINGRSISRSVTFSASQFTDQGGTTEIKDIQVEIEFAKPSSSASQPPYYNEIGFSLKHPVGGPETFPVTLVLSGTPDFGGTSTFATGFLGDSFDGTLRFSNSATVSLNEGGVRPDEIPTSGVYHGAFDAFIGLNGDRTFELTIGDNDATDSGAVLEFKSFKVTITAVPEPSSLACLGLLASAGAFFRRRRA